MKVKFFIIFIVCLNDQIPLNEGLEYYDAQPGTSEDFVEEDKLGIYGNNNNYSNDFEP